MWGGHWTSVVYENVHIMENVTWGKNTMEQEKNAQQSIEGSQQEQHAPETAGVLSLLTESTLSSSLCRFGPPAAGLRGGGCPGGHKGCPEKAWLPSPLPMG